MMKCELCGRENQLSFHHFIPVCLHSNKWFKNNFTKEELQTGIYICENDCHKQIHIFINKKDMGKYYNTKIKLLNHAEIKKYIKWIKDKK